MRTFWMLLFKKLSSHLLRHEIIEDEEGNIDRDADPLGDFYNEIEQQNKDACAFLMDAGYTKATLLKMTVNRALQVQQPTGH